MPDLSVAPVAMRTNFRGSRLYKSFVEYKVDRTLGRAKLASGAQRLALVQSCQNLPSLPTGVKDTIEVVSVLFDDELAMSARMQYFAECSLDGCLALAKQWDPNGIVGVAALCMSETGDLTDTSISLFSEAAGVLSQISFEAKHPVIQAAITCLKQLKGIATPTPSEPWLDRLAASAIVCRLKLNTDSMHGLESFKYDEVPAQHQANCFKILKDYLKLALEEPSWWRDWSNEVKRQKEAKRKPVHEPDAEDKGNEAAAVESKDHKEDEAPLVATAGSNPDAAALRDETTCKDTKTPQFKVGDLVVGMAAKFKSSYDQKDAQVIAVLAKRYKVKMLTGDASGAEHKYTHAMVRAKAAPATQPSTADDGNTIAAEAAAVSDDKSLGKVRMQQLEDLWE